MHTLQTRIYQAENRSQYTDESVRVDDLQALITHRKVEQARCVH